MRKLAFIVSLAIALVACGDEDSDIILKPDGTESSSACEDCDDSSSSKAKFSSSSSVAPKSSSSETSVSSSSAKVSSSSAKSSSSKDADSSAGTMPCNVNTDKNCMKDERDGKTYKTVTIGTQTWMAENLNYAYNRGYYNYYGYTSDSSSWCFNDSADYCAKYGRLYTWAVAMDSAGKWSTNGKKCGSYETCSPVYPVRGICPEGWHLPTETDWKTLFTAVGGQSTAGKMLKSTSGWYGNRNGTDAFGFSALPAGDRVGRGIFGNGGSVTSFWRADKDFDETNAYIMYLIHNNEEAHLVTASKTKANSVRCLKDDSSASVTPQSSSSETSVSGSSSSSVVQQSSSSFEPKSSSSVTPAVPCKTLTEDNCEYGSFTDERNGKTYKTVKIGDQVWMAENLHYLSPMRYTGPKYTQSCYDNDTLNCIAYGSLHLLKMTIDSSKIAESLEEPWKCTYKETMCAYPNQVQGVCPDGWHLPKKAEWETLAAATGGKDSAGDVLKSQSGWIDDGNGSDSFGFNLLPAGIKDGRNEYIKFGERTAFWLAPDRVFDNGGDYVFFASGYHSMAFGGAVKSYGYSVRCIKDKE